MHLNAKYYRKYASLICESEPKFIEYLSPGRLRFYGTPFFAAELIEPVLDKLIHHGFEGDAASVVSNIIFVDVEVPQIIQVFIIWYNTRLLKTCFHNGIISE